MKTIKSSKDITTLEVGDEVVFGDLKYKVCFEDGYHLQLPDYNNDAIFNILDISKRDFVKNLGINTLSIDWEFPEVRSLEALTAIVSALFKEYEKQNEIPKTWEEFCKRNKIENEYYISNVSDILCTSGFRDPNADKNICTSKQEAKAFLALMQLRQLRKAYVKDWKPDWTDNKIKFVLYYTYNVFYIYNTTYTSSVLSFPTYELAEQFLTNFKDLLEIAKPLL